MNRCAVVLIACLGWPTPWAAAQSAFKNSALEISVRFDDDARIAQRVRTEDGGWLQLGAVADGKGAARTVWIRVDEIR